MAINIVDNCRCEVCLQADPNGRRHVFSDGHVLETGPIRGPVVLSDGSVVDVTPSHIEVESQEQAAEIAHAIGLHWQQHGHPDDVEVDEKTGKRVQRKFVYDDSHYRKHGPRAGKKG